MRSNSRIFKRAFEADFEGICLRYGSTEVVQEKIFSDSLSAGRKLMDGHDCLYIGGFASLLSQNSYCATLRI